ncbi:MAG: hypothetical protein V1809_04830 [Planctomycetota bacterium]
MPDRLGWMSRGSVCCCVLAVTGCVIAEKYPENDFRTRIQVIPRVSDAENPFARHSEDKTSVHFASRNSFAKWKTYRDETVSFVYPDDPGIALEIMKPGDHVVIHGMLRSEDPSFSTGYRLAAGATTIGMLMVGRSDEFDDGICLCGAIVFKKYLFHNDALFRFSFLDTGDVKQVQALHGGVRAIFLEWTHSALSQDVYVKIASSLRLEGSGHDPEALRRRIYEKYGFDGRLGFLEPGMSENSVIELLGPPARDDNSLFGAVDPVVSAELAYGQVDGRALTITRVPMKEGVFHGFGKELPWREHWILPPEKGSVEWIGEMVENVRGGRRTYTLPPLDATQAKVIFDRFLEIGPTADGGNWGALCRCVRTLREKGFVDERILPVIRKRFLDPNPDLPQHFAAWLLYDYDSGGSRDLFSKRIRLSLDEVVKVDSDKYIFGSSFDDLSNLFIFMGKEHPQTMTLLLEAMKHPNARARRDAFSFWNWLPSDVVRPRLHAGLADSDKWVRQKVSEIFAERFGSVADLPVLKERLGVEKNEATLKSLRAAITRIGGRKTME